MNWLAHDEWFNELSQSKQVVSISKRDHECHEMASYTETIGWELDTRIYRKKVI